VPPAGTPLYPYPPFLDSAGRPFHQPKFGGEGWIGSGTEKIDGYSVVLTWPAQDTVVASGMDAVAAWPSLYLAGGAYFIQSGYWAGTAPCQGSNLIAVFASGNESSLLFGNGAGPHCQPGQKIQLRAERSGTIWIFSSRIVGGGAFVEDGRYDFGIEVPADQPVMTLTEMYDYDNSVLSLHPITYGPVLVKTGGPGSPSTA
jgi:hypothetical protein